VSLSLTVKVGEGCWAVEVDAAVSAFIPFTRNSVGTAPGFNFLIDLDPSKIHKQSFI